MPDGQITTPQREKIPPANCTMPAIGPSRSLAKTVFNSPAMASGCEVLTGTSRLTSQNIENNPMQSRRGSLAWML